MPKKTKPNTATTVAPVCESRHEIEAEINARLIAIRQSDSQAIEHMENVIGAILQSLDTQGANAFNDALAAMEAITPEAKETVMLVGEQSTDGLNACGDIGDSGEVIKSKRQRWREEIALLEGKLAAAIETPEGGAHDGHA